MYMFVCSSNLFLWNGIGTEKKTSLSESKRSWNKAKAKDLRLLEGQSTSLAQKETVNQQLNSS